MAARLRTLALKAAYAACLAILYPLSLARAVLGRNPVEPQSVLHVAYMNHVTYYWTRILREYGWKADYLAIGTSAVWDRSDYLKRADWRPGMALDEFRLFWGVMARYEVVHFHFMQTMSVVGWELPLLRRMGRKVVAYFAGCEARDRELNMKLHPAMNICQQCDYNAVLCTSRHAARARRQADRYADVDLVSTPDMRDFRPRAVHFPFFAPPLDALPPVRERVRSAGRPLKIVHATNHPGIEGTERIRQAVDRLRARGHAVEFVFLKGVPHEEVLRALADADLTIGKMKMGYYANAQIEGMILGVPAVTWVRPEFMNAQIRASGLIVCHLDDLEATLEHYLTHPEALEDKRRKARSSILALHDNRALAAELIGHYRSSMARA